ncbi:EF-hand protein [Spironucleus salmonicida]|uniref:EF-hand protein n=1 Tax=Spironucleus salmonicida TaxID=348837 RepID=V6LY09_9EUKA|nr:EF-hand protein [Spironucleus salmonicida]|eukprot:EST48606.1 EF-hand protein [Spironucleus salmonicida]
MSFIIKNYGHTLTNEILEQLKTQFNRIDTDGTGYISYVEVSEAFSTPNFQFPASAAKLLSRVFSSQCQLDQEQFSSLYAFVLCVNEAFRNNNQAQSMSIPEIKQALLELNLNFTKSAIIALCENFGQGSIGLEQFYSISSMCLLGRKLFVEWDHQDKGEITVGLEQVLRIAMWFM